MANSSSSRLSLCKCSHRCQVCTFSWIWRSLRLSMVSFAMTCACLPHRNIRSVWNLVDCQTVSRPTQNCLKSGAKPSTVHNVNRKPLRGEWVDRFNGHYLLVGYWPLAPSRGYLQPHRNHQSSRWILQCFAGVGQFDFENSCRWYASSGWSAGNLL